MILKINLTQADIKEIVTLNELASDFENGFVQIRIDTEKLNVSMKVGLEVGV